MAERPKALRIWLLAILAAMVALLAAAAWVWRDDILRTGLDPKVPFQTYAPPPAPDYTQRAAWALLPADPEHLAAGAPPADVFFVGPTTYDGGGHWNAPIDKRRANQLFDRVMAPNYAGPFVKVGRIFAPRYRQASLYTQLTLREDAREARRFAYGDVEAAFDQFLMRYDRGRPLILVGVEQGGLLSSRLLAERIMTDPALRHRLVAAYLIETVVPARSPPAPPCVRPGQTGCVAAWASAYETDVERAQTLVARALAWQPGGGLEALSEGPALCFNPILGAVTNAPGPSRLHLGAANATGLEWGARPPFITRHVSAQCGKDGVLRVSKPKGSAFKAAGSWADRRKAPGYNLFYADLEADAAARLTAMPPATPAVSPAGDPALRGDLTPRP